MKLILLFVGFTVGAFIVGLVAHFAMNMLRMILMTVFVTRRHDEAEKRLSDPRDRILEATRIGTFDPGTPWFPSWLPPLMQLVWFASGLLTVSIRYALRVWWPVLLLAAVLTAVYSSGRSEDRRARTASSPTAASNSPAEYTDNVYNFAFQFPSDWKLQKTPQPGEAGEVRVVVQSPRKSRYVMALVGKLRTSVTKEQFETSPRRDFAVNGMIELTIEQVYKKTSHTIGASRMLVSEKREVPSDMGIKFYISTAHFVSEAPFLVAGIHVVPYGRDYMVTFMMITPVDPKATAENEIMTKVFNSFHIVGERTN